MSDDNTVHLIRGEYDEDYVFDWGYNQLVIRDAMTGTELSRVSLYRLLHAIDETHFNHILDDEFRERLKKGYGL